MARDEKLIKELVKKVESQGKEISKQSKRISELENKVSIFERDRLSALEKASDVIEADDLER
jgi:uncharacterized coiled-coil protein SlyX